MNNATRTAAARDRFTAWAAEAGYKLAEPFEWMGSKKPHPAVCPNGHACAPYPSNIRYGMGGCRDCTGGSPGVARDRFMAWATEAGYTLAEPFEWMGALKPHPVICPQGHPCNPRPNSIQQGQGGCRRCAGLDTNDARNRFTAWAASAGYVLSNFEWIDNHASYEATCPDGHACEPRPSKIQQGRGGCRICAGQVWDVVYVTQQPNGGVKFGITSGDPRPRLAVHARDGYTDVLRLHTKLAGRLAPLVERRCLEALKAVGLKPVRGREYFDPEALPIVLGIVDQLL